jgi:KUP system potassium uptake protein
VSDCKVAPYRLTSFWKRFKSSHPFAFPELAFSEWSRRWNSPALYHNVKHNSLARTRGHHDGSDENVLHVSIEDRIEIQLLGPNFYRITAYYGFKDTPNVPGALRLA